MVADFRFFVIIITGNCNHQLEIIQTWHCRESRPSLPGEPPLSFNATLYVTYSVSVQIHVIKLPMDNCPVGFIIDSDRLDICVSAPLRVKGLNEVVIEDRLVALLTPSLVLPPGPLPSDLVILPTARLSFSAFNGGVW